VCLGRFPLKGSDAVVLRKCEVALAAMFVVFCDVRPAAFAAPPTMLGRYPTCASPLLAFSGVCTPQATSWRA
jgi:hypothetical protein